MPLLLSAFLINCAFMFLFIDKAYPEPMPRTHSLFLLSESVNRVLFSCIDLLLAGLMSLNSLPITLSPQI